MVSQVVKVFGAASILKHATDYVQGFGTTVGNSVRKEPWHRASGASGSPTFRTRAIGGDEKLAVVFAATLAQDDERK
ncbi:hypothetical protein PQ610_02060 [Tardisphaera miroshnichenkoae]